MSVWRTLMPVTTSAVRGGHDERVIVLLDSLAGLEQRVQQVVGRGTRADAFEARPDLTAGAGDRVALQALVLLAAEDRFAPRGVALRATRKQGSRASRPPESASGRRQACRPCEGPRSASGFSSASTAEGELGDVGVERSCPSRELARASGPFLSRAETGDDRLRPRRGSFDAASQPAATRRAAAFGSIVVEGRRGPSTGSSRMRPRRPGASTRHAPRGLPSRGEGLDGCLRGPASSVSAVRASSSSRPRTRLDLPRPPPGGGRERATSSATGREAVASRARSPSGRALRCSAALTSPLSSAAPAFGGSAPFVTRQVENRRQVAGLAQGRDQVQRVCPPGAAGIDPARSSVEQRLDRLGRRRLATEGENQVRRRRRGRSAFPARTAGSQKG